MRHSSRKVPEYHPLPPLSFYYVHVSSLLGCSITSDGQEEAGKTAIFTLAFKKYGRGIMKQEISLIVDRNFQAKDLILRCGRWLVEETIFFSGVAVGKVNMFL